MNTRKQLKKESRSLLKPHFGSAMMITLFTGLLSLLLTAGECLCGLMLALPFFTDTIGTPLNYLDDRPVLALLPLLLLGGFLLLRLLVMAPLKVGIALWNLHLAAGEPVRFSEAFSQFGSLKKLLRAALLGWKLAIRQGSWWLICTLPALLIYVIYCAANQVSHLFSVSKLLIFLTFCLVFLVCQLVFWQQKQRYFLASYLCALFACKTRDAIKLSTIIMQTNRQEAFSLRLSYLPFYLANLLLIPALFTLPLIHAASAGYAKQKMEAYERAKEAAPAVQQAVSSQTVEIPDLKQFGF